MSLTPLKQHSSKEILSQSTSPSIMTYTKTSSIVQPATGIHHKSNEILSQKCNWLHSCHTLLPLTFASDFFRANITVSMVPKDGSSFGWRKRDSYAAPTHVAESLAAAPPSAQTHARVAPVTRPVPNSPGHVLPLVPDLDLHPRQIPPPPEDRGG